MSQRPIDAMGASSGSSSWVTAVNSAASNTRGLQAEQLSRRTGVAVSRYGSIPFSRSKF